MLKRPAPLSPGKAGCAVLAPSRRHRKSDVTRGAFYIGGGVESRHAAGSTPALSTGAVLMRSSWKVETQPVNIGGHLAAGVAPGPPM